MSTKAKIQKVRAEVEAHEARGWLKGYEEGLATREEEVKNLQGALEARNARKKDPKTAREALALAWELAHPVKVGRTIPGGMTCLKDSGDCITTVDHPTDWTPMFPENIRTLDPLPEPGPDWLDAPAVIATTIGNDNHRTFANVGNSRWHAVGEKSYPWTDLTDVTPLYPKGQEA